MFSLAGAWNTANGGEAMNEVDVCCLQTVPRIFVGKCSDAKCRSSSNRRYIHGWFCCTHSMMIVRQ